MKKKKSIEYKLKIAIWIVWIIIGIITSLYRGESFLSLEYILIFIASPPIIPYIVHYSG